MAAVNLIHAPLYIVSFFGLAALSTSSLWHSDYSDEDVSRSLFIRVSFSGYPEGFSDLGDCALQLRDFSARMFLMLVSSRGLPPSSSGTLMSLRLFLSNLYQRSRLLFIHSEGPPFPRHLCCSLEVFRIFSWSSLIFSSATVALPRPSSESFISPIKFLNFVSSACGFLIFTLISSCVLLAVRSISSLKSLSERSQKLAITG